MKGTELILPGRSIGEGSACYIIAEVAQAHEGSLGMAHSFIDAVAAAGADAIKFQTHIAEAESTLEEPFRVAFSSQDGSRYDYWRRMEFSLDQWRGLAEHCLEKGVGFLSSPFSLEAVDLLEEVGVAAWKVGSGEVNNRLLLERIARSDMPVILSTGMSDWSEIDLAVDRIQQHHVPFCILQCTSKYPTSYQDVGLNVLEELRSRFAVPVGLSDHSGKIFPGLAAMARGIELLEVHVTFSRHIHGPDVSSSITLDELKLLVEARDAFRVMQNSPVDKDKMAGELQGLRRIFNKSVALRAGQSAGTLLQREMLTVKKPGTGIPAADLDECVGRRLIADTPADRVLVWQDLE